MPVKRYKNAKGKADKLFSEIIRARGYCEAEGWDDRACSYQLQTAHICSRRYSATRTDLRNAFCLCGRHHRHFTDMPREFSRFISGTWAQAHYDAVHKRAVTPSKVDWLGRITFLERVKRGEISIEQARELEGEL
jgi:hypothetical protein